MCSMVNDGSSCGPTFTREPDGAVPVVLVPRCWPWPPPSGKDLDGFDMRSSFLSLFLLL